MGSNQEIQRIQAWITNWYGGECPFSMEDIRNICRGPMRQVLLDFLIPRFRTDDQIKVIRSNLFLNDVAQAADPQTGEPPNQFDKQINTLKGKLNEVHQEKIEMVERIVTEVEKIKESKQTTQERLMNLVSNYEKFESRAQLVKDRVTSTSILVQDLNNAKPIPHPIWNPTITSTVLSVPTPGSENSSSPSITGDPVHVPQLKALYSNALELLDLFFIPTPSGSFASPSGISTEIQALTASVATQTADLAHSGIGPGTLEKWARSQQDSSTQKVKAMSKKFSDVMNPIEELQNETDAIYIKLMTVHVEFHLKNKRSKWKLNELKEQNKTRLRETVFNDPSIVPSDLLNLLRKEQQSSLLAKCREMTKQLKQIEGICHNDGDEDLLGLLCDDSANLAELMACGNTGSPTNRLRASLGPGEANGSFAKQEALEDVSCTLLRSIPHSCKQLENVIQQCKNLVLERFPKILSKEETNADKKLINNIPTEIPTSGLSADDIKIKIPKQFIPNYDLLGDSPFSSEQSKDDLLGEVFRMQKELETKMQQSEALLRERGSFVPSEV